MKNGLIRKNNALSSGSYEKLDFIKKLYDLPVITHEERVDRNFFNHVKQRHLFLAIAIFDSQKRILVIRDFSKSYGWELPGGSIEAQDVGNISNAAQTVVNKIIRTDLYDIQPIAVIKNNFQGQDGQTRTHLGIALIARTNGHIEANQDIEWGFFLETPKTMFTANYKIAKLGLEVMKKKIYQPAIDEITSSNSASWRYRFHQLAVNKTIGLWPSLQLQKAILQAIGSRADKIVDTSCGDNELILSIARSLQPKLVVCNDVSPRHLKFLGKKASSLASSTQILFTNHDVLDLPFNQKFDIALSKNTLHHLNTDRDKKSAIKNLKRLATKTIIVDVENPDTSFKARLWNTYYVKFLKDQGRRFLTLKQLDQLLSECSQRSEYRIKRIFTLRGTYLLATIETSINMIPSLLTKS